MISTNVMDCELFFSNGHRKNNQSMGTDLDITSASIYIFDVILFFYRLPTPGALVIQCIGNDVGFCW